MGSVFVPSMVDLCLNRLLEVGCFALALFLFLFRVVSLYVFWWVLFFNFCSAEALSRLDMVIRHPNAQHSDNVMAYDNAVSAFGKICQFHRDSIDATQVDDILLLQTLIFCTSLFSFPCFYFCWCVYTWRHAKKLIVWGINGVPLTYCLFCTITTQSDECIFFIVSCSNPTIP